MIGKVMDIFQQALSFNAQGINVIPLKFQSKEPIENFKWKKYNYNKQNTKEIENLFCKHNGNVGTICGEISDNLVVLDCDTNEVYQEVIKNFSLYEPKVVKSYRGGHVYIKTTVPVKSKHVQLNYGKVDVRSNGLYVVSEGSIHPNGSFYELLSSNIPRLNINSFPDLFEADVKQTSIKEVLKSSGLLDKLFSNYYKSRSEADMAVITFLIRKGYGKEYIKDFLTNVGYNSKYTTLLATNPTLAEKWLELSILNAENLGDALSYCEVKKNMEKIKELMCRVPFEGRSGASFYKTMLAHVNVSLKSGKSQYHFSVREACEIAGISHVTFMKRNKELIQGKLIKIIESKKGFESNVYEVNVEEILSYLESKLSITIPIQSTHTVTDCESYGQFGIFEHSSMGHSANQIYNLIGSHDGISLKELIEVSGRARNTVKRCLVKMINASLVHENNKYFFLTLKSAKKVSCEEGYIEKAIKRKINHQKERVLYRESWK